MEPIVQNRKTHTLGWKVVAGALLSSVHLQYIAYENKLEKWRGQGAIVWANRGVGGGTISLVSL